MSGRRDAVYRPKDLRKCKKGMKPNEKLWFKNGKEYKANKFNKQTNLAGG
jgi:hypothetical protein